MRRRTFIKLSLSSYLATLLPSSAMASEVNFSTINFDTSVYNNYKAQTIILFLSGGASHLASNLTNLEEIEANSYNSYKSYFRDLTKTENGFWKEAGGDIMEALIENGDMTIFRTCYSKLRDQKNIRDHGSCSLQVQTGRFEDDSSGIATNLAKILNDNQALNQNSIMPFITMNGDNNFFATANINLNASLKPVGIDANLENPYKRNWLNRWYSYTQEERASNPDNYFKIATPELDDKMNQIAHNHNKFAKIRDAFEKRTELEKFINKIKEQTTPDLGSDAYSDTPFSKKFESAIKVLATNPDSKLLTLSTSGLGGWDDHNEARNYQNRMLDVFKTLKSAIAHLKAIDKIDNINIIVCSEFGRNVNLNSANGWDHGNLQSVYILGGKNYFNHKGVVGETKLDVESKGSRLWLKPKERSYWFEPTSIAATIYKLYGIENPEVLTEGNKAIDIFS